MKSTVPEDVEISEEVCNQEEEGQEKSKEENQTNQESGKINLMKKGECMKSLLW